MFLVEGFRCCWMLELKLWWGVRRCCVGRLMLILSRDKSSFETRRGDFGDVALLKF